MPATTTFDSTKETLKKLLEKVQEGGIQLPEFQREWVWEDDRIKSLLASVSLSYPDRYADASADRQSGCPV